MSKKYMHPSRKKLLDIAYNRDNGAKNTHGWSAKKEEREVGEEWTDSNGTTWIQMQGYKTTKSKFDDVRAYIRSLNTCKNAKCETLKIDEKQKKIIRKTGYCINCLAEKEHNFRTADLWKEYEMWKVASNEIDFLEDIIKKFEQALRDASKTESYVNSDGTLEKWEVQGDIDKIKEDIQKDIDDATRLVGEWKEIKETNWEIIKDKYVEVFEK